jgi:hypothetical protein
LKRVILLATAITGIAAIIAVSSFSATAQEDGQYAAQYGQASEAGQAPICAPWSKAWDISEGWWYFQWYRWCYDPSTSDPSLEGSWYQDLSNTKWGNQVNLCPEQGSCTVTPTTGGLSMRSST